MENEGKEIAVRQAGELAENNDQMVARVSGRVQAIQHIYKKIMLKSGKDKDGREVSGDYGLVPGCGDKPALLKPGAEKLLMAFRVAPSIKIDQRDFEGGHREVVITTTLTGPDGSVLGEGVGSCSTMESKYRYRGASRKCPACGKETVIKGKEEYGGGWLCFAKKGGCGAKWPDGAAEIESQAAGRIENPDIADQYNTVLKMSKKRSLIDAVLTVFGASDIFTQDIDENIPETKPTAPVTPPPAQAQPEAPLTTSKDLIQQYRKRAITKGKAEAEEFDAVLGEWCMNVAGKGIEDLTEAEGKNLLAHIAAHYTAKKQKEEEGKKAGKK